jgi:hypothetical protein
MENYVSKSTLHGISSLIVFMRRFWDEVWTQPDEHIYPWVQVWTPNNWAHLAMSSHISQMINWLRMGAKSIMWAHLPGEMRICVKTFNDEQMDSSGKPDILVDSWWDKVRSYHWLMSTRSQHLTVYPIHQLETSVKQICSVTFRCFITKFFQELLSSTLTLTVHCVTTANVQQESW